MPQPDDGPPPRHIADIDTNWIDLRHANDGTAPEVTAARQALLERYREPVYRYLRACLGSADAADEVFQEFALRLLRGAFRRADPEKGRFRDLLKTALHRLIIDHRRKAGNQLPQRSPDAADPADSDPSTLDSDRQLLAARRTYLLDRAWQVLADTEQRTGRPLHTVLRFRADHDEVHSPEIARALAPRLGKEVTAEWVRKYLQLARDRFAAALLQEVRAMLPDPTPRRRPPGVARPEAAHVLQGRAGRLAARVGPGGGVMPSRWLYPSDPAGHGGQGCLFSTAAGGVSTRGSRRTLSGSFFQAYCGANSAGVRVTWPCSISTT